MLDGGSVKTSRRSAEKSFRATTRRPGPVQSWMNPRITGSASLLHDMTTDTFSRGSHKRTTLQMCQPGQPLFGMITLRPMTLGTSTSSLHFHRSRCNNCATRSFGNDPPSGHFQYANSTSMGNYLADWMGYLSRSSTSPQLHIQCRSLMYRPFSISDNIHSLIHHTDNGVNASWPVPYTLHLRPAKLDITLMPTSAFRK